MAQVFIVLAAFAVLFGGCDAMDDILPSAGSYKIIININDSLLDDCSYITSTDNVRPSFVEAVSDDRDVTALVVSLRNSSGENIGFTVIYEIGQDDSAEQIINDDEIIFYVKSLDDVLPDFPFPEDLTPGIYSIITNVMSGKNVLQRDEKTFFYLGFTDFSFEGINVYLPGIEGSPHLIPTDTVVLLETNIDSRARFNPYIIWYEGKKIISEGYYNDGFNQLFWKAPEQSGFFAVSAEVFPIRNFQKLSGYKRNVSLVISSLASDIHLVTENIPQLVNWYKFENKLIDSKAPSSGERVLRHAENFKPKWMGANGTYGLVIGEKNIFILPKVYLPNETIKIWQTLFRFKPVNDGCIFSIMFDEPNKIFLSLFMEESAFTLTLSSPAETISQVIRLPSFYDDMNDSRNTGKQDVFITAGLNFSVLPGLLTARLNILNDSVLGEHASKTIALEVEIKKDFQILLGYQHDFFASNEPDEDNGRAESAAILDEFALYYKPHIEILIAEIKPLKIEDLISDDNTHN